MTSITNRETAKIYEFPAGELALVHQRCDRIAVAPQQLPPSSAYWLAAD